MVSTAISKLCIFGLPVVVGSVLFALRRRTAPRSAAWIRVGLVAATFVALAVLVGIRLRFPRDTSGALPWLALLGALAEGFESRGARRIGFLLWVNAASAFVFWPLRADTLNVLTQWALLNAGVLTVLWLSEAVRPAARVSYAIAGLVCGALMAATGSLVLGQVAVLCAVGATVAVLGMRRLEDAASRALPAALPGLVLICLFEHGNYSF